MANLRTASNGSNGGFLGLGGGDGSAAKASDPLDERLATLESAIATADREKVGDTELIQEAKTLLATQPLRVAIEQGDTKALMAAIWKAERAAEADGTVIKVSDDCRAQH